MFANATYIADARGKPISTDTMQTRFKRYIEADAELATTGIRIHGLRALAVCDRRIAGHGHQRIAAAVGMSLRQVMHYSKSIDQRLAAGGGEREQNEAVKTPAPDLKTTEAK